MLQQTWPGSSDREQKETVPWDARHGQRGGVQLVPVASAALLALGVAGIAFAARHRHGILATVRMLAVTAIKLPKGLVSSSASAVTALVKHGHIQYAAKTTVGLVRAGLTWQVADSSAALVDRQRAEIPARVGVEAIKLGHVMEMADVTAAMFDRGHAAQATEICVALNLTGLYAHARLEDLALVSMILAQRGYHKLLAEINATLARRGAADVAGLITLANLVAFPHFIKETRDITQTMVACGFSSEARQISEYFVIAGVNQGYAAVVARMTVYAVNEGNLTDLVMDTSVALAEKGHAAKCAEVTRAALAAGEFKCIAALSVRFLFAGHHRAAWKLGLAVMM